MKEVESSAGITLEIKKGPRDGETFTYDPITNPVLRIGRVVRGNTLAIKDSGISSKHLSLQFNPDSCKWVLKDLDSSNGTFLNGCSVGLEPGKGYVIRDGDRVKIGESTDFVCKVFGGGGVVEGCGGGAGLRRNPRRRGALGDGKDGGRVLGEIGDRNGGDDVSMVLGEKCPPVRRGRRKGGGVAKEVLKANGKEDSEVVMGCESMQFSKLKEEVNLQKRERKQPRESLEVVVVESKRRRGGRKDNVLTDVVIKAEPLVESIEVERLQLVEDVATAACASTRRTCGAKKEEKLSDKVLESDGSVHGDEMVVSTKSRTGLRRRRKIGKNVRVVEELERLDIIEEVDGDASEKKESKDIQDPIQDGEIESGRDLPDGNRELGDINKEKECVDPSIQKGSAGCDITDVRNETDPEMMKADAMMPDQAPDLSQVTVREWLDWLEVNLPKQIIAETEKLFAEMRSKGRRVKEYRAEQVMARVGK